MSHWPSGLRHCSAKTIYNYVSWVRIPSGSKKGVSFNGKIINLQLVDMGSIPITSILFKVLKYEYTNKHTINFK